jgi:hypothetical protein
MTHCSDIEANQRRAGGRDRMARTRARKRSGLRCVQVEIRDREIDALIGRGLLLAGARNDPAAISRALHDFFDVSLT